MVEEEEVIVQIIDVDSGIDLEESGVPHAHMENPSYPSMVDPTSYESSPDDINKV